jgi:8-oxo-dGTP pyrophosphatase MutT (NUDIX family)
MLIKTVFKSFIIFSYQTDSHDAIYKLSQGVVYAGQSYGLFKDVLHNEWMQTKTRKAQVVIAVLDSDSQSFSFLLLQTNKKRGEFWQNVTGKIDEGETYEDGALREVMEETGVSVELIVDMVDLKISHEFIDERKRNCHEKAYLLVLDKKWDVKIDPHEHQDHRWVAMESITPKVVKHQGNFEALEKSLNLLKHWGL